MPRKGTEGARSYDALTRLAREECTGEVSEARHVAGRARLVAAIEHERSSGGSRMALHAGLALAAAVALVVGSWSVAKWRTPEWTVEGAVAQGPESEGYVRAPVASEATIHFADGSAVSVAPKGRARVVSGGHHHMVLEDGHLDVRVARGGGMLAWAFDAGPFTVHTSPGTTAVEWSGDGERLDVWSRDAETTVQGGAAGAGVSLHGGDHLTARVREGELRVVRADGAVTTTNDAAHASDAAAPEPATNAVAEAPDTTLELPDNAPDSSVGGAAGGKAGPTASWSALVARGQYDSVLRSADALGSDNALSHRPLSDLAALADASRYRGRTDLSERALMSERSRFPGSKEAHTAAFLLGRLADDQRGAPDRAIAWYTRYLAEAPTGPFASDALGRKMLAVQRTQGPAAARPLADQYARRFPHGAYAAQAEALRTQ